MLKISQHEGHDAVTLKIEGRVAGATVSELEHSWLSLADSLGSKQLSVDLCGVTHMDARATEVLADIYKKTRAQFVADSPMTRYYADQAKQRNEIAPKEN